MSTLSLKDLESDETFLSDLREGNFVLVLGAGFSFGIRNSIEQIDIDEINAELLKLKRSRQLSLDSCKTIPLSNTFVDITNILFDKTLEKHQYQLAANEWGDFKLEGTFDLSSFFRKLFIPDKKYIEANIEILKSIFIPTWHNIYTLNFDTVLEEIISVAGLSENYDIKFYPDEPGLNTRAKNPTIAHLHGIITIPNLINLVFDNSSYQKIRQSQQSLYDNLHAEIKSGKKLLILGTQFDESVIDDKLTHDLDDIVFFHFDTKSSTISSKKFAKNPSTSHYITLYVDEKNQGAKLFLQFLKDNRSAIEHISIDGCDLINQAFINKIEKEGITRNYIPEDFYLAKQYYECQWYGIIKGWDVDRKAYKKIVEEVLDSFKDEQREPKIIARLLGRGGSGKSTLLRRLAIDCAKKEFAVIWVKDKEITKFNEKGVSQFSNYPQKQFLIIIEDWYRIKNNLKENASILINSICNLSNVRIIIGDRTTDGSIAKEHCYNVNENKFQLGVEENEIMLAGILEKIREWESLANELLKQKEDFNSSLYLILFTIGRNYQKKKDGKLTTNVKIASLTGHFQSIVLSDLKTIAKDFPGLAKALFYWAKVYTTSKIYIGYDLFEKIANNYNENKAAIEYHLLPAETKSILEIYINKTSGDFKLAGDLELVAFNHDTLAEEGIASIRLPDLNKPGEILIKQDLQFGENIKIKMLDLIIQETDTFSSSAFLSYILHTTNENALSNTKRLDYIDRLYKKGNTGTYLNHLFYDNGILNTDNKKKYAKKFILDFLNNEDYASSTISLALHEIKNSAYGKIYAIQLLERFKIEKINFAIICNCLINLKDKPEGVFFATQLLDSYLDKSNINYQIICNCLINLKNKPEGITYAVQLLDRFIEKKDVHHTIVCNCLINLKDTPGSGKSKAIPIIEIYLNGDLIQGKDNPQAIVSNCLINLKDEPEGIIYASQLLKRFEKNDIYNEIICNCLIDLKDKPEGIPFAIQILERYLDKNDVNHQIICNCLINLKGKPEEVSFATQLLERFIDKRGINHTIVCNCLINLKDRPEGFPFAIKLLDIYLEKNDITHQIICNCLINLKDKPEGSAYAAQILKQFLVKKDIHHAIVCNCLINLKDKPEGISYATQLLSNKDWKKESWSIIFQSLHCFSLAPDKPRFVVEIVKTIIAEFFNKSIDGKGRFFRYLNLMKIPLHDIAEWRIASKEILKYFMNTPARHLITNALKAYSSRPEETFDACMYILRNWKTEILKPIPQLKSKPEQEQNIHYGDHIKIALGHAELKPLAKKTAKEIQKAKKDNLINIPAYLFEIADKMVTDKDFYPEWDLKKEDELIINQAL